MSGAVRLLRAVSPLSAAEYSDGAGTLEDAYEHAMQAKDVDLLIVTDHSNYFDTKEEGSSPAVASRRTAIV